MNQKQAEVDSEQQSDGLSISFEALTIVGIQADATGVKLAFGPGDKPKGDGKMYVMARASNGSYPIENSLLSRLKVGDVLAWKDAESYKIELEAQRKLLESTKH
jgi:hypothetical protein